MRKRREKKKTEMLKKKRNYQVKKTEFLLAFIKTKSGKRNDPKREMSKDDGDQRSVKK